jgi:hypothetical protein
MVGDHMGIPRTVVFFTLNGPDKGPANCPVYPSPYAYLDILLVLVSSLRTSGHETNRWTIEMVITPLEFAA